jgi:acyl carrier protein
MTVQQQSVTEALEQIVRRFAPKTKGELQLTPATRLIEEAGIDSPRMIDIVLDVEDRFGFTIEDHEAQQVRTFGDLVILVNLRSAPEAD